MHWHRGLNPFWFHKFGFKPLLGIEHMAPIRPQLPANHANHSATETSMCVYVCVYVCMYVFECLYVCVCVYVRTYIHTHTHTHTHIYGGF